LLLTSAKRTKSVAAAALDARSLSCTMTHLPKGGEKEYICPFLVDRARTGQAKCRAQRCSNRGGAKWWFIATGSLRVAEQDTSEGACLEHGRMVSWRHLGCVGRKFSEDVETKLGSIEAAEGFSALSLSDQTLVLGVFADDQAARSVVKEEQRVASEKADEAREAKKAAEERSKQRRAEQEAAAARGDDDKPAKKAKKAANK
jgi:hypothetical protein